MNSIPGYRERVCTRIYKDKEARTLGKDVSNIVLALEPCRKTLFGKVYIEPMLTLTGI